MARSSLLVRSLVSLSTLGLVAACGSGGAEGSVTTAVGTTTTAAPAPPAPAEACRNSPVKLPSARAVSYPAPTGSTLGGAVVGSGPRAAVLLHQKDNGYCGYYPFLAAAGELSFTAYLVDLCGYAASSCQAPFATDRRAQVKAVVDHARRSGATSVTLVGASMGGSYAAGFAHDVGADAVVDLSGPSEWDDAPSAAQAAPRLTMPLLVALSPDDRRGRPALEAMVRAAPTRQKAFVWAESGHGWGLLTTFEGLTPRLTPLGHRVVRWVGGDRR